MKIICSECGKVINKSVVPSSDVKIKNITSYGICKKCKIKMQPKNVKWC